MVFAYSGFELMILAASETRGPREDTGIAPIMAGAIVTLIYFLPQLSSSVCSPMRAALIFVAAGTGVLGVAAGLVQLGSALDHDRLEHAVDHRCVGNRDRRAAALSHGPQDQEITDRGGTRRPLATVAGFSLEVREERVGQGNGLSVHFPCPAPA
jgi:amino acid transporter